MSGIIEQMLILFTIMLFGYLAYKRQIFDDAGSKTMSRLVVNITNPALIISSVVNVEIPGSKFDNMIVILIAFSIYIILPILAVGFRFLLPFSKLKKGDYQAMFVFTNIGFMGIPVANAVLGPSAVFYLSIFMIPFNIMLYSYGTILLTNGSDIKITLSKIMNPCVIAAIVALFIYFLNIPTHNVIRTTASTVGAVTTPVAMMIIGIELAKAKLKDVFLDYRMYLFILVKMILCPIVVWLIYRWFIHNELLLGIIVIVAGMPCGTNLTLLCKEYDQDCTLVSKAIVISTIMALITIPILAATILQ